MKNLTYLLFIAFSICFSQETYKYGSVKLKSGEIIEVYGLRKNGKRKEPKFHITNGGLSGWTKQGEKLKINRSDIDLASLSNGHGVLKNFKGKFRTLIFTSDKYYLASITLSRQLKNTWETYDMIYIYDRKSLKQLEKELYMSVWKEKRKMKRYDLIAEYFGDCKGLMNAIKSRIKNSEHVGYFSSKRPVHRPLLVNTNKVCSDFDVLVD